MKPREMKKHIANAERLPSDGNLRMLLQIQREKYNDDWAKNHAGRKVVVAMVHRAIARALKRHVAYTTAQHKKTLAKVAKKQEAEARRLRDTPLHELVEEAEDLLEQRNSVGRRHLISKVKTSE